MNEPKPTLESKHTKAWRYDLEAIMRKRGVTRSQTGSIDSWVIFAPWANCAWHSYVIHLMHLRPYPGFNAKIYCPNATHELVVAALDPDWRLNLMESPRMLMPVNFVGQWIERGENDEAKDSAARERITRTVMEIIDGDLSPDTDYTQAWIARYGAYGIKGDPRTVGQTQIFNGKENITIDPRPATQKPKDHPCPKCGAPMIVGGPFPSACVLCDVNKK